MATTTTIVTGLIGDSLTSDANTVTDEHFTSSFDEWVACAHQNFDYGTVTVETTDDLTLFTEGTDYQINYKKGEVKVLSGGTMLDATAYHISYVYPESGLAKKINDITSPKQAAGKFFRVATAKISPNLGVAVIVTEN